jgi:hypothetical protein
METLTLENAPDGTLVVVGHPANGHTARKDDGQWLSNSDGRVLDLDPRDVTRTLFVPERDI